MTDDFRFSELPDLICRGPETGIVAITEIVAERRRYLALIWWRNRGLNDEFQRQIGGPVFSLSRFDLRERRFLSVSMWPDIASLRSLGDVPGHIEAVHTALKLKRAGRANYTSSIYSYSGNWKTLLWPDQPALEQTEESDFIRP
jgi:hypothetical protein